MNQFLNVNETYPQIDTVLIGSNVNTLFNNAGYFESYADLAVPGSIPFLNVRNNSVGTAYNNFNTKGKMTYPFHLYAIGLTFFTPLQMGDAGEQTALSNDGKSHLVFAAELPRHCAFEFKIGQDEKIVNTVALMPGGQGIHGWQTGFATEISDPSIGFGNATIGKKDKRNKVVYKKPLVIPRDETIEGNLRFSPYGLELLKKLVGPGDISTGATSYPSMSGIRVSLFGRREVQQRGELHK